MRIGMDEMIRFCRKFFPSEFNEIYDPFVETSGFPDLFTTCIAGRNAKCAAEFSRHGGLKTFGQIEQELLNGQKLQGTETALEIHHFLKTRGAEREFRLFTLT
mmetsp:Transcript_97093/g.209411  ORF Transcript_97093/g.209411 Transcript_97093/m.209411 type:complete len:103 (+) Transcript_97093:747-1055(+)